MSFIIQSGAYRLPMIGYVGRALSVAFVFVQRDPFSQIQEVLNVESKVEDAQPEPPLE